MWNVKIKLIVASLGFIIGATVGIYGIIKKESVVCMIGCFIMVFLPRTKKGVDICPNCKNTLKPHELMKLVFVNECFCKNCGHSIVFPGKQRLF